MRFLSHPDIQSLLRRAERAADELALLKQNQGDTSDAAATLAELHRRIGRKLHIAARKTGAIEADTVEDVPTEVVSRADVEELTRESWYTDEVEVDTSRPLFDLGELPEVTEIPESDPLEGLEMYEDEAYQETSVTALISDRGDPDHPLAKLVSDPTSLHWSPELERYLQLMRLPNTFEALPDVSAEATALQWATSELHSRANHLPMPVQTALVGLLSARARNLQELVEVDIGPRHAIEQLTDYCNQAEVPKADGLHNGTIPEFGTWADDAQQWLRLLTP